MKQQRLTEQTNHSRRKQSTAGQQRYRLTIHVPLADNDGIPFPAEQFANFEAYAGQLAGGVTDTGEIHGQWYHNGTKYRDTNRQYILIIPRRRSSAIATAIAKYIRTRFRQLAVYAELTPVQVMGF